MQHCFTSEKKKRKGHAYVSPIPHVVRSIIPVIPTTAVAVIQKNKYRILSPPLAGTSCEGHFICPFCRKGSSCPHCNFLPDGRSRHNPASQSSKSKGLSDGRREGDALVCPSFGQLYSSSGGLFPAFRTFLSLLPPLTFFPYEGSGKKA